MNKLGLVLDSVDPGSIKAKFRDIIAGIPDEQVKEGDWRKVIGGYLIRAKYQLLKWLDGTTKISHRDDIRQREGSLLRAAEETDRKSTRLNSSHVATSYAVFCLKKKR